MNVLKKSYLGEDFFSIKSNLVKRLSQNSDLQWLQTYQFGNYGPESQQ